MVELACDERGAGAPLVILHGLFGSKRNWASVAAALAGHRRVFAADLRNHGASPWDERHDYPALAADVARLIETRIGGPAAVIGHSMGGKAAMLLALDAPWLVERLVVVDIPPAASTGSMIDVMRAMRALPLESFAERSAVDAALAPAIPDSAVRAFLAQNVVRGPEGLRWAFNLEALARHGESIRGFPAVPPGRAFTGPTLFIVGGRSDYVRPEHRAEIERLFPAAKVEAIPGAGHWVHAEAPGPFLETAERFLNRA